MTINGPANFTRKDKTHTLREVSLRAWVAFYCVSNISWENESKKSFDQPGALPDTASPNSMVICRCRDTEYSFPITLVSSLFIEGEQPRKHNVHCKLQLYKKHIQLPRICIVHTWLVVPDYVHVRVQMVNTVSMQTGFNRIALRLHYMNALTVINMSCLFHQHHQSPWKLTLKSLLGTSQ